MVAGNLPADLSRARYSLQAGFKDQIKRLEVNKVGGDPVKVWGHWESSAPRIFYPTKRVAKIVP